MSNSLKFKVKFPKLFTPLNIQSNADILKYSVAGIAGFLLFDELNHIRPSLIFSQMADANLTSSLLILLTGRFHKKNTSELKNHTNAPQLAPKQP